MLNPRAQAMSPQQQQQLAAVRPQLTKARQQLDQLKSELQAMDNKLSTAGQMNQMTKHQLQESMQRQSQMLQMVASLMKAQHDVLKSVINNLRA